MINIKKFRFTLILSTISGGFTCADMLRQNGFRGRILLFTLEGTLPYDRVSTSVLNQKRY